MKNRNRQKYIKCMKVPGLSAYFGIMKADGFFAKKGFTTWYNGCGAGPAPTQAKAEARVADYMRAKLTTELEKAQRLVADCESSLRRLDTKGIDAFIVKEPEW